MLVEAITSAVAEMRHNVGNGMAWMTHDEVERIAIGLERQVEAARKQASTIMVHGEPREIAEFDKPDTVEPIIDKQIWPDK